MSTSSLTDSMSDDEMTPQEIVPPEVVGTTTRKVSYNNTILWHVPNFFDLPPSLIFCFRSPKFAFRGAEWYLRMYPNCDGWTKLYLIPDKTATVQCLRSCKLGMKRKDGTDYKTLDVEDFSKKRRWGSPLLLERATLTDERNQIAPKGTVTFFCTFDGGICESKEASSQTALTEGLDTLLQNLREFLKGEDADIIFRVKDREFKAHKAFLKVRSPVFKSMFSHKMKEYTSNVIDVTDCDPIAFGEFLHFVYCGKVEELSVTSVFDLYFVADKYDVPELRAMCLEFIIDNLSMDTFLNALTLALRHNEPTLLKNATSFFVKNSIEIAETVEWLSFQKENLVAANELVLKSLKFLKNKCRERK